MLVVHKKEEKLKISKIKIGDVVALAHWYRDGQPSPRGYGIVTSILHEGENAMVLSAHGNFFVDRAKNFVIL